MRGATECARRVKLFFSSLRSKLGKVGHPPITDPITQLILGVLSRDTPESKACEGLERLRGMVVDYNELRVIPPIELAQVLGDFPDARLKCEDISRALNAIFAQEHTISLDRIGDLPRKDQQALLERIDGLEAYTRARIRLLGLRQHAIPLDEAMWAAARTENLVAPRCSLGEAQPFLERQIAEDDALEFFALLKRHAWSEYGAAVRKRSVERILSVPPDRTTRNMLQMITGGAVVESPAELPEVADEWDPEPAELTAATNRAASKGGKTRAAQTPSRRAAPPRGKSKAPAPKKTAKGGESSARRTAPAARPKPPAAGRRDARPARERKRGASVG